MGRLRNLKLRPSILILEASHRLKQKILSGIKRFYGIRGSYIVRYISLPAVCRIPVGVTRRGLSTIVLHGSNVAYGAIPSLNS